MSWLRWSSLVLFVWLVGLPASRAEIGTCFTTIVPMTEPATADCDADEPDCSLLPEPSPPPSPAGPRCLEAGPTCHSGEPGLTPHGEVAPMSIAVTISLPRRPPGLLPGPQSVVFVPAFSDRHDEPPVPPPKG